jgi:hypothetical protein
MVPRAGSRSACSNSSSLCQLARRPCAHQTLHEKSAPLRATNFHPSLDAASRSPGLSPRPSPMDRIHVARAQASHGLLLACALCRRVPLAVAARSRYPVPGLQTTTSSTSSGFGFTPSLYCTCPTSRHRMHRQRAPSRLSCF